MCRFFTTTDILLRSESNGIFSRYLYVFSNSLKLKPAFLMRVKAAPSVGFPMSEYLFSESCESFAVLQSVPIKAIRRSGS